MPKSLAPTLNRFRSSLVAKIFTTCFVATHLPLLAIIAYLIMAQPADALPVLAIVLCATLVATGAALLMLHRLVRPLGQMVTAVRLYGEEGHMGRLSSERHDEVGVLARGLDELMHRLEAMLVGLRAQAFTDPLTRIGNRRWLGQTAESLLLQARREKQLLGVVVFDIDHFKQINDEFGHHTGDAVLVALAEEVQRLLRAYDLLARLGGEEFCVVLQGVSSEAALQSAEVLRAAIARIEVSPLPAGGISASFGVHLGDPCGETLEQMIDAADAAMYRAKRLGRNRICFDHRNVHVHSADALAPRNFRASEAAG